MLVRVHKVDLNLDPNIKTDSIIEPIPIFFRYRSTQSVYKTLSLEFKYYYPNKRKPQEYICSRTTYFLAKVIRSQNALTVFFNHNLFINLHIYLFILFMVVTMAPEHMLSQNWLIYCMPRKWLGN